MANVEGETVFLYDDEELAKLIKTINKSRGKGSKKGKEETEGAVEDVHKEINLIEFFESREVDKLIKNIEALKVKMDNYDPSTEEVSQKKKQKSKKKKEERKPLYRVAWDGEKKDLYSLKELVRFVKENGKRGMSVQRYKGLGEMNPHQLWETTMDPDKRTVQRVLLEDAVAADQMFTVLMGDQVQPRKEYIQRHAHEVTNLDI